MIISLLKSMSVDHTFSSSSSHSLRQWIFCNTMNITNAANTWFTHAVKVLVSPYRDWHERVLNIFYSPTKAGTSPFSFFKSDIIQAAFGELGCLHAFGCAIEVQLLQSTISVYLLSVCPELIRTLFLHAAATHD